VSLPWEMNSTSFKVRRSRIDGRGLFAKHRIRARKKMGEMVGEVVSVRVARRRARNRRRIAIVELGDGTAVDATDRDGDFRYVNHSCSPNAFMRTCYGRVEFYALRDIAPGEEITCDYGETHHAGTVRCKCGGDRCRGCL